MSYVFDFKTGQYRREEDYRQEQQIKKVQEAHKIIESAKALQAATKAAKAQNPINQAWNPMVAAGPTPAKTTPVQQAPVAQPSKSWLHRPIIPTPQAQTPATKSGSTPLMRAIDDLIRPAGLFSQGALSTFTGGAVPEALTPQNRVDKFAAGAGDVAGALLAALGAGKAAKYTIGGLKSAGSTAANALKNVPMPAKVIGGAGVALGGREMYQGATQPNAIDPNFLEQTGASMRAGTGMGVGLIGAAAKWQGKEELGEKLSRTGKNISQGYETQYNKPITWKSFLDPDFYSTTVAQAAPISAMLIPAMLVGYKGTGAAVAKTALSPFKKAVISAVGGAALSRPIESALEAGGAYEEMLARDGDPVKAEQAANEVFRKNLALGGLDAVQLAAAFAPMPFKAATTAGKVAMGAGRVGAGALTEAGEEGYQEVIQRQAMGDPVAFDDAMKQSMAVGGLFGLGMGGAGTVTDMIRARVGEKVGTPGDQLTDEDLDNIASDPAGRQVVEEATREVAAEVEQAVRQQPVLQNVNRQDSRSVVMMSETTPAPVPEKLPGIVNKKAQAPKKVQVQPETKTQPPAPLQADIQVGDTVIGPGNAKLTVVDASDRAMLTVKNEKGSQYKLGRRVVKTEPHREKAKASVHSLSQVESELGQAVDEEIGEVKPNVGMSVKITGRGPDAKQADKLASVDPKVEERWQASRGVSKEPIIDRAKQGLTRLINLATREYEHLPRTGEFSRLRFDLLKLKKQRDVAGDRALRIIQGLTVKQDPAKHELFTRAVILRDLKQEAEAGRKLPFGYTPETLEQDLQRVNEELDKHQDVAGAVDARKRVWTAIRDDYIKAMQDIGYDASSKLTKEDYYRHQVLEFANLKRMALGTGKKLSTPTKSGFLRQREGSELDINTDYLQAESQVMADMLYNTEVAKTIKSVDKNYNIVEKLKKQHGRDWEKHIPEGYTTWQPREGNVFYFSDSVPASVAEKLYTGALEELGVKAKDLRQVLAKGQRFREFVIKEEVAATLDNLTTLSAESPISQASKWLQRKWKVWTLVSPRRWFRYNFRNITGDADAAFAGNPTTFKKTPRAIQELYQVFTGDKSMTPDMKDWFERGGMQTLLQAQELGDVNKLKMFVQLQEKKGSLLEMPLKVWQGYWKSARLSTDFREAILRYAAYLDYLEQMKDNKGKPKNFGASIPDEVMSLDDTKDRAFKLSNELLGAYDQVGVLGQALREHLIPFWSWNEVNFRRYKQLMINAARDGELAHTVGRKLLTGVAVKSPMIAYRVGMLAVKASALWVMLALWNNTRFPELEKGLSEEERNRPHIIFGQDEDGKILYFSRLGALQDFVDWFGVDAGTINQVHDILNGKKSVKEVAAEMARRPVNKLVQGVTPFIKAPAEIATGKKIFPDIFSPGQIRDRGLHIAQSLGLENEYRGVMKLPSKPYEKTFRDFVTYTADPELTAHYNVLDEKQRYLKKINKQSTGSFISPKSNALYNFKQALYFKDKEATKRYLTEYITLGGTGKGLQQSLETKHPLYGLNDEEKVAFIKTLDREQILDLKRAIEHYEKVYGGLADTLKSAK